jgi:hypothetical protein
MEGRTGVGKMKRSIDKLRHGDVFYSRITFNLPPLEGLCADMETFLKDREDFAC